MLLLRPPFVSAGLAAVAALAMLTGCAGAGGGGATASRTPGAAGACPVEPIPVAVSVNPWTDVVTGVAGDCAVVSTVLQSSAADPHDYEPMPGDILTLTRAKVVVLNGAGYDTWAAKAAANARPEPRVVDLAAAVGVPPGANPHLWYSPTFVMKAGDAVSAALTEQAPQAADYLAGQKQAWQQTMKPYLAAVAETRAVTQGRSYATTEPLFQYMAQAAGLVDLTPQGFALAVQNETDPSPADVVAFEAALGRGRIDALVENAQTVGSLTQQVVANARARGVPVVPVTETQPDGVDFVRWQVDQLAALRAAYPA